MVYLSQSHTSLNLNPYDWGGLISCPGLRVGHDPDHCSLLVGVIGLKKGLCLCQANERHDQKINSLFFGISKCKDNVLFLGLLVDIFATTLAEAGLRIKPRRKSRAKVRQESLNPADLFYLCIFQSCKSITSSVIISMCKLAQTNLNWMSFATKRILTSTNVGIYYVVDIMIYSFIYTL